MRPGLIMSCDICFDEKEMENYGMMAEEETTTYMGALRVIFSVSPHSLQPKMVAGADTGAKC